MGKTGFFSNDMLNSMSAEQIQSFQEERLRAQVKYCYDSSSFYKQKFHEVGATPEDVRTLQDLRMLPIFMNKDQERKNALESLRQRNDPFGTHLCVPVDELYLVGTTSGTTGLPTFTYSFTKRDIDLIATALGHRFRLTGVRKGDRVLFLFALGIYATTMSLWGLRSIGALPIDVDARAGSEMMLSIAELTRPSFMATTVSLAEYLINKAPQTIGKVVGELGLKGLMMTGEIGISIPQVKKRIESAYGCPVFDYWAPAGHAVAITCLSDDYSGMHGIAPDLCTGFDDLVDPATKEPVAIEDGAVGEMVITSLKREAAPLIKFATGDIVQLYTKPCPYCGFSGKRIKLLGRADDMLIVKGVNVYPAAIKRILESFSPRVTGEMRIILREAPPRVVPPLELKVEYGHQTNTSELGELAGQIGEAAHRRLKIRPSIDWVAPGQLEKSTRKTPLFEKLYETEKGK